MSVEYNKVVACAKSNLQEVRGFVRGIVADAGIADEQANLIVVAVEEVCANLIIHSHSCNPSTAFEINVLFDDKDTLIFELIDDGAGFNFDNYREPDLNEIVKRKRKGGLGLMLVRRIMDKVEFSQRSGKAICRLIKHLP